MNSSTLRLGPSHPSSRRGFGKVPSDPSPRGILAGDPARGRSAVFEFRAMAWLGCFAPCFAREGTRLRPSFFSPLGAAASARVYPYHLAGPCRPTDAGVINDKSAYGARFRIPLGRRRHADARAPSTRVLLVETCISVAHRSTIVWRCGPVSRRLELLLERHHELEGGVEASAPRSSMKFVDSPAPFVPRTWWLDPRIFLHALICHCIVRLADHRSSAGRFPRVGRPRLDSARAARVRAVCRGGPTRMRAGKKSRAGLVASRPAGQAPRRSRDDSRLLTTLSPWRSRRSWAPTAAFRVRLRR